MTDLKDSIVLEVAHPDTDERKFILLDTSSCAQVLATYYALSPAQKRAGLSAAFPLGPAGYRAVIDQSCSVDGGAPPAPVPRAQSIGSVALLFEVGGNTRTGFPFFLGLDEAAAPATSASSVFFVDQLGSEGIGSALARVRAGGVTQYTQAQVSNVRGAGSGAGIALPTTKLITYNITSDSSEFTYQGQYQNDHFATQDLYRDGKLIHSAYIPDWPGNSVSLMIPNSNYQRNRTEWKRLVMYENQRAKIREVGKKYFMRFNFGRDQSNTDPIIPLSKAARFNNGELATNNGFMVPQLHLLRQYVEGNSSDTENPWHYMKQYVLKLSNDFKQDVLDGICFGFSFVLNGRQEDGFTNDFVRNSDNSRTDTVLLSDYSAAAIADFKARMGVSQDPPQPGNYLQADAFAGTVGVKWLIYRQELYVFFKSWVQGLIHSVIPGCPVGDDYGLVQGAEAANHGVANFRRLSANSQLVKLNPSYEASSAFFADLVRSNMPAGALMIIETDTDWVVTGQYDPTPIPRNPDEVANVIAPYFARGAASIAFGQVAAPVTYAAARAVALKCIERGMMQGPITPVATPDVAHQVSYTVLETLSQPGHIPQSRWFEAGGSATPVQVSLIDNLPY